MSWFKKLVRGAENVFRKQVGKPSIEEAAAARQATNFPKTDLSPVQQQEQMGGGATSNAGEGVVSYQTKGKPGLQQTGKAPTGL